MNRIHFLANYGFLIGAYLTFSEKDNLCVRQKLQMVMEETTSKR